MSQQEIAFLMNGLYTFLPMRAHEEPDSADATAQGNLIWVDGTDANVLTVRQNAAPTRFPGAP